MVSCNDYTNLAPEQINKFINLFVQGKVKKAYYGFWNRSTSVKTVRALFKYLNYDRQQICKEYSAEFLTNYGMRSARKFFSLYDLINLAFPEYDIKPWELKKVTNNHWDDELQKQAIIWLVEEVYKITPDEALTTLTRKDFDKNCLLHLFKLNKRCLITTLRRAYPNL